MCEPVGDIIRRHGKPMSDVLTIKRQFFEENEKMLEETRRAGKLYSEQPPRKSCKLCGFEMPAFVYFKSHDIDYCLCANCGHVNGIYDDGPDFSDAVYRQSGFGDIIYKESSKDAYFERMNAIYLPKARFLSESFEALGVPYKDWRYLDVGAGSGYMVAALREMGMSASGVEISESQAAYGNRMLEADLLAVKSRADILKTVEDTDCGVVTFIHVLEHLDDLRAMLKNISRNKNIRYVYFAVPLFSLACIFEIIFPEVFNRQLGWTHTHLFSKESLDWMYESYGFTPLAIWDFGSDIMDLYRAATIMLDKNGANPDLIDTAAGFFKQHTDAMQLVVDKSGFASETHVLIRT